MRIKIFSGIILFFFAVLILGLSHAQILKGTFYEGLSEKNRIRALPLPAPRGKIYERSGTLLVTNRISFDVEVVFREISDKEKVINLLSDILGIKPNVLAKKIEKAREMPFMPVKILENIKKEKAIQIEEAKPNLSGVIVTTRPLRNYLYKNTLAHVIGYLGEIGRDELRKYKTYGYRMQDFVGKDGIERTYNDYLRGTSGGLQVEVDSKGRHLRRLAVKEAHPGRDLHLTIDIELQKFCYDLLKDKRGVIIAMDPSRGAILALVSNPGFDPNVFVRPNNFKEVSSLLENKSAFPMLNRAIGGTYAPGSVFKIVIATAALESARFSDRNTLSCSGTLPIGNRLFHCWRQKGHGTQNILEGVKNSCNVFFYQLGLSLGADTIARYAFRFGFGRPTGIDLPGESQGLVPTPSWKKRKLKAPWFKGETANYAIGQGYLVVSPIQILCLVSAIANGGKLVQPFLAERIENIYHAQREPRDIGFKEKTLVTVKESLRMVVNAPGGTGGYARSKDIVIAGKTGTAQNPHGKSHAWFVGFAPFENPGISLCVFIEHGGKGGLEPARFAKKIIEEAKKLKLL